MLMFYLQKGIKMLVYLATPYTHSDYSVMVKRFEKVNQIAAKLMSQGIHIYSPISHTHPISEIGNLPKTWDYWEEYDRKILAVCGKLMVYKQDGWEKSVGVQAEIKIAQELNLPIEFIDD